MNRGEFLEALRAQLQYLPQKDADDIIRDQEEYIRDAVASGRSEQEVINGLGDPKAFAAGVSAEAKIEKAAQATSIKQQTSSAFSAVLALVVLAPLNLIFVLGPFLGVCGILIGGWAVAGACMVVAASLVGFFLSKALVLTIGVMAQVSTFFLLLGIFGLGSLGVIIMLKVTEIFLKATVSYLRWNLKFVNGRV
jgi:uncharacterized membrane protein